jgi:hypothetical protein
VRRCAHFDTGSLQSVIVHISTHVLFKERGPLRRCQRTGAQTDCGKKACSSGDKYRRAPVYALAESKGPRTCSVVEHPKTSLSPRHVVFLTRVHLFRFVEHHVEEPRGGVCICRRSSAEGVNADDT